MIEESSTWWRRFREIGDYSIRPTRAHPFERSSACPECVAQPNAESVDQASELWHEQEHFNMLQNQQRAQPKQRPDTSNDRLLN